MFSVAVVLRAVTSFDFVFCLIYKPRQSMQVRRIRDAKVCVYSINETVLCVMRGMLGTLVILVCGVVSISAIDVHFEQENTRGCVAGFDVRGALDNSTLYEQVFKWMHERDVLDWNYSTEVRLDGAEEKQCVLISYKTVVHAPMFFMRLLQNFRLSIQFPIAVRKEVCLTGNTVTESASVTAPLVHELRMIGWYHVEEGKVKSSIDAQYTVPWYVEFLVDDMSEHLRENFKEKVDAVAASLCAHRPAAVGILNRAAKSYSPGTLRQHTRKYRLPAPAQHRLHLAVESPIHSPFGQRFY